MTAQNNFLVDLGNITNNEKAEIEAIKKEFIAHMEERVNIWVEKTVEKIKKEIEDSVLKREYEALNDKKRVTGECCFEDFFCDLEMVRKDFHDNFKGAFSALLKKIRARAITFPEYDRIPRLFGGGIAEDHAHHGAGQGLCSRSFV